MCPESLSKNPLNKKSDSSEDLSSYRFLLGDFGIQILAAIAKGARTMGAITTLSGVPLACVKGRTPVLKNLNLIHIMGLENYEITKKGIQFLHELRASNFT